MMQLSVDDLSVFFASGHAALADDLRAHAPGLVGLDAPDSARYMGGRGWYRHLMPEGEAQIDLRSLCLIREALAYYSPQADSIFAVHGLGSYPLLLCEGDRHAERIARLRAGEQIAAFALTEPEAGSDVASMRSVAAPDGDGGFCLRGEKTLISNVGIAGHYIVFANADTAKGRDGITAFLVAAEHEGLEQVPMTANIDHPIGALTLRDCSVAGDSVIGEVGQGFRVAMDTLDTFRVTVGAAAVGMARRAVDEALAHVRRREQFGKALASQPVVQSMLANMVTELDAARLLVMRAAHQRDVSGTRITTEAAMAKLFATEAAQRIIDSALQLHGGQGVMRGAVVEELYRAIRPLRIYEGTSEIQRLIIGRAVTRGTR